MESRLQEKEQPRFTNKALFSLIIPLAIESLLGTTIGFVGTIMVASAGETAVSAVSLVDNLNNLILFFLSALAAGGAIIIAQNIGKGSIEVARTTAKQLLYTNVITAIIFMVIGLLWYRNLLALIFGNIEPVVMHYAQIYFSITVISYPFISILHSTSAVFRSMGVSKTPMFVTLMMSVINIVICAILILGFGLGVMGAAIAALTSRVAAAVVMLILVKNRQNLIFITQIFKFKIELATIKGILRVGIPAGLDSGLFQLGKVILQSLIATFGTASIAANAVVGQISMIMFIPGGAISMAIITVVGQCVGAGDYKQAISYAKRLVKLVYLSVFVLVGVLFLTTDTLLSVFNLSHEANDLARLVLYLSFIVVVLVHPLAFTLPNVLRASGDVRFTMISSMIIMLVVRIVLSYVIEHTFSLGLLSVWIAMYTDWFVRAATYTLRFLGQKWRTKKVV